MRRSTFVSLLVLALVVVAAPASAHVPYFEHRDFTEERPFAVRNSVEQSIAVYSWIETDFENPATDVDVYAFTLVEPTRVYLESIVPVCPGYEEYHPWFALVGPGLPAPEYDLPFDVPDGDGVLVFEQVPGDEREVFYEFFGGKSYYQGPRFDEVMDAGAYTVYFWDPFEYGGDYVAVIGAEEIWGFRDILRALIYTPLIRKDRELHVECP